MANKINPLIIPHRSGIWSSLLSNDSLFYKLNSIFKHDLKTFYFKVFLIHMPISLFINCYPNISKIISLVLIMCLLNIALSQYQSTLRLVSTKNPACLLSSYICKQSLIILTPYSFSLSKLFYSLK